MRVPPRATKSWLVTSLSVVLFVSDRIFKHIALTLPGDFLSSSIAAFALFKNTGIAFSIPVAAWLFWPTALLVFLVLSLMFAQAFGKDRYRAAVLGCILLGALSNLIDRAFYGATIDYLIFFNRSAVNIADAMIVAGTILLLAQTSQQMVTSPSLASPE